VYKTLLVTLLVTLSACAYDVESTSDFADDTEALEPSVDTDEVDVARTKAASENIELREAVESFPADDGCRELKYIPQFEGEWQYCIDIESNSRPFACHESGPPKGLSCWPMLGLWTYDNSWCCCNTDSCVPN
jgi:hypothetical protein